MFSSFLIISICMSAVHAASDHEIVGGNQTIAGKYTWTVGLRSSPTGRTYCGGSLISSKVVLTAAHCVEAATHVAIGSHFLHGAQDGENISIQRIIKHPSYDSQTIAYDIAILILESASRFTPIRLASATGNDNIPGTLAFARGWGKTSEDGDQSQKMHQVAVRIITDQQCAQWLDFDMEESMLCAGGEEGKDTCQNDSGGPLTVKKTSGEEVLVGVVSWGIGCGRHNKPGVYARVSAAIKFIREYVPIARDD